MIRKTGRCLCGAIEFEAGFADLEYGACHCRMCRRWSSGPYFAKEAESLTVVKGESVAKAFRTSDWAERVHCAECGTNLWYHFLPTDIFAVSVGALDDQSDMRLGEEIYIDCKPAGYAFAGETKKKTEAEIIADFDAAESG